MLSETIDSAVLEAARKQERARICRALIEERRLIRKAFGKALCANPNWDMFLELYDARAMERSVYQSALCLSADIPDSSAHRWTAKLASKGILARHRDEMDKRQIIVTMTDDTKLAMDAIMDGLATWVR